jgi:hypothetical protein
MNRREVVAVRSVADAVGVPCTRAAILVCYDCGIQECESHTATCDTCQGLLHVVPILPSEGAFKSVLRRFATENKKPPNIMSRRRNSDLEKIRASLDITCPHCNARLWPDEQQRVDWDHIRCP